MIVFESLVQAPSPITSIVVRTSGESKPFVTAIRQTLRQTAPSLQITDVLPIAEIVNSKLHREQLVAAFSASFALLAIGLMMVGLYGIIAHSVERRRREIGLRLALGAGAFAVARLVTEPIARFVGVGIVVGMASTLVAGRAVQSLVYGFSAADGKLLLFTLTMVCGVSALTGAWAVRRAVRIDPIVTLRDI